MRGSRLLIGIGILVLLAVLSIPAFLIGNGQVYLHAYTLSQHYQLSARYVPQRCHGTECS